MKHLVVILLLLLPLSAFADGSENYAAANLPALSREWHAADYQAVSRAIVNGQVQLPKFSSDFGSMILKRLTDPKNLALAQSRALPIEMRMQECMASMSALNSLIQPYLVAANRGEKVNAEMAALLALMLRVSSASAQNLSEFISNIPHDDKYPTRMEGVKMVGSGLTNIFLGAETSLSERPFYSPEDITLILQAMAEALPSIKDFFAPDFRAELKSKLNRHRRDMLQPSDIQNLERMIKDLEV